MRAILPGRPSARLQAVTTGTWDGKQIISYISGNALVILDGPNNILQTTYHELPDELVAIVFDEISGKVATASASTVHVYKPYGRDEGALRWSLQCHLDVDKDDAIETLSWGLDEELLIGSSSLTLYSTHNGTEQIWTKKLANPAKYAQFSYDTSLIATAGKYDRLVKVWRRLSLADQRFDYGYLPHPALVTGIHWRRPFHRDQTFDNVLYTICADNKLRIWAPGDTHGLTILQHWAEIDLMESIQPRSLSDKSLKRYAFMIDNRDFTAATESLIQQATSDEQSQLAMAHLIEVANRSPDVCVVLDERGNISAWGLESVGCKVRKPGDIFNIAHVEGLKIGFDTSASGLEDNAQFYPFCSTDKSGGFCVIVHHFDGRLEWMEGPLDKFFDPSKQKHRLRTKTVWTGHSSAVKKIVRSATGKALISRTQNNESVVWARQHTSLGDTIVRCSTVTESDHVHRVWLLQEGRFIAFLHHESISIWDARQPKAVEVARRKFELRGKPVCLLCIPEEHADKKTAHLATISTEMQGVAWEVHLPSNGKDSEVSIEDFGSFDLGSGEDVIYVLPVDPAGSSPVISGFLDIFARDVAISYSASGVLKSWTARPDLESRKLEWLLTASVETCIENPSLGSGTSIRKAALVSADRTSLSIWNMRSTQLEHEERFENHETIQDLDWTSTPDNQSILAVGFQHRVILYAQLRYDYLDDRPSWAPLRELSVRDWTSHPIGDSVWLGNGGFVIASGNQLCVKDKHIEVSDRLLPDLRLTSQEKVGLDVFTVVSRLNGPLPVFHPQFLAQCMLSGRLILVQHVLLKLWNTLKFYNDGDPFDSLLEFDPEEFGQEHDIITLPAKKEMHSSYADFTDDEPETLTEDVATALNDILATRKVPLLSAREQMHLMDIIECVGLVEKHRRSIDENGCRFLLFFRQHMLRTSQQRHDGPSSRVRDAIPWREIVWAWYSGSQDILTDLVTRHFHGKMLWPQARESGIFMWMTDLTTLRAQFEVIARNEYTRTDEKNPVDCSLYYLALRKKAVLVGLWRMATWSREQSATQRLLQNNFDEARWKTAALKNAYALMGKRRFEYAAAFFVLAGHLRDAVNILSNQLGDMQLAIAVARVYEGDDGPILEEFLKEKVLPQAVSEGNKWLANWAFWLLKKRDQAVRALILPLETLIPPSSTPTMQSKLFLTDDPALVVLYKQLREKSLQTLRGALSVSPRAEWDFVIHTAGLYQRMGCDLLALDLVKTWEFLTPPTIPKTLPRVVSPMVDSGLRSPGAMSQGPNMLDGFDFDPRKVLRRRSSLVVADLPVLGHAARGGMDGSGSAIQEDEDEKDSEIGEHGASITNGFGGGSDEKKKKLLPTQFAEPDANSLLDSFGF
ncbi:WD repeat protein-like protein [Tothia fuscella]|uniref:WD repeat protein-like protein n=1 Tax=Tothia fuscella TaxID=1048955 RepID=A0A9P4TW20_9PEZI|nr:WD repeat protein-like protein [Tothia fuscella]